MPTIVELTHERKTVDAYGRRAQQTHATALEAASVFNAMMKLIYPAWDPNICEYQDGVITDPREWPKPEADKGVSDG